VFATFREAGAILVGKSNLSDLGIPPEASSWVGGSTRNPFDSKRTAGGSSGGAAAAVAAGLVGFDWGTDIGGSIRLPAAFCGILGLRLSSETWPVCDAFPQVPEPLKWMFGQGPLTRTTDQMQAVLSAAAGLRKGSPRPFSLRGAVIHAPRPAGRWPTFADDVAPALKAVFPSVSSDHGLPGNTRIRNVYDAMWCVHFEDLLSADPSISLGAAVLAVLSALLFRGRLGNKYFHPVTAELLLLIAFGRYTLYRNRVKALRAAHAIRDRFRALWDAGWIVVAPVCTYPPPRIGRSNWNRSLLNCTVAGNLADSTSLSVPFGKLDGLPRAIQLMGPPGCESLLIDLADRLLRQPPSSASRSAPSS
jgi:amidase